MSALLPSQLHPVTPPQTSSSLKGTCPPLAAGQEPEQPKVSIRGDLRMRVTCSEAMLHPITGRYSIETAAMQEPLYILWNAEGQVSSHRSHSTSIAFDMREARAGETWTYLVAVQVVQSGAQGRAVQSGVFVQIVVTGDQPMLAAG